MRSCRLPRRVSSVLSRYPLRYVVRSPDRSCRPAPISPSTSVSISSCTTASAHAAQEIAISGFRQKLRQGKSVLGHRVLVWFRIEPRNSTLARRSDGHLPLHTRHLQISTTSSDATPTAASSAGASRQRPPSHDERSSSFRLTRADPRRSRGDDGRGDLAESPEPEGNHASRSRDRLRRLALLTPSC